MKNMRLHFKILLGILLVLGLTLNVEATEKRLYPPGNIQPFLGLDDTSAPPTGNDGHAADLQNIELDETGKAIKRNGTSYEIMLDTNAVTDNFEAVTSIYELYKSNGTRIKLSTCGNKIFSWSTGSKTNITNTVTITEGQNYQWSWITALDYAIGTNGTDPPIKTDGVNASPLNFTGLSSALTKAKCVIWWKNYLIWGNTYEGTTSYTTRIRWSNVGTIQTYSDSDYVDIATLGGQQIEGFGILYDNLYVFLTDSIYKVSLVGGNELINVSRVSEGIGCIARNSIQTISIGNAESIVFLARDKRIYSCDGTRITDISVRIQTLLDTLVTSMLPYAVSVNDTRNSHYYLSIATSGTTNNLLLDLFYINGEWSKFTKIYADALGIGNDSSGDPQVYYGNYSSFIYQLNNVDYINDVAGLSGTFDDKDLYSTSTASGLQILYENSLTDYTKLLMHFEGVNGSQIFVDESGKTTSAGGDTKISNAQYQLGTTSGLFDGADDYITVLDSNDWDFGTGDFTIDCWVRWNGSVSDGSGFVSHGGNATNIGWMFFWAGNYLQFENWDAGLNLTIDVEKAWTPSADTWYHVALVRSGNNFMMFINGTQIGTTVTDTSTVDTSSEVIVVGCDRTLTGQDMNGWIDELRISKGVARWTSDFTPPTTAYTNSDMASRFLGGLIKITSGLGKDEERVICDTTSSGLVVTASTLATGLSVYSIGDIDSFYVTKWLDMSEPSVIKNFGELYVWAEKKVGTDMDLDYATEMSPTIQTTTIDLDSGDIMSGTSIKETNTWSGVETNFIRKPLNVSGRFLKIRFRENDIDETMELYGYSTLYWSLTPQ